MSDRSLKRAGMDYMEIANLTRHDSWENFRETLGESRLILLTTKASGTHIDFKFEASDTLLLGRESAGVPDVVHEQADGQVKIPMAGAARSLNVAVAGALVLGEALRQTGLFPS